MPGKGISAACGSIKDKDGGNDDEYKKINCCDFSCPALYSSGRLRLREEKTDPASEQVLKISITPEPSPTPAPEEINPEAVVTNGNLTMVNSYLAEDTGEEQ